MLLFTHHAHHRLAERLSLTTTEVSNLVEHGRAVYVGTEPGSNKQHHLFYSEPDHQWLVAVIDMNSRTVITLLPLDYHELIAWKIPKESVDRAQRLVCGKRKAKKQPETARASSGSQDHYTVKAFVGKPNGKRTWKPVGTWTADRGVAPRSFNREAHFVAFVSRGLAERNVHPDCVEGLLVQHERTEAYTMLDEAPVRDALREWVSRPPSAAPDSSQVR